MSLISFAEFMHFALYDVKKGYYTQKNTPFGKQGDFVTAPLLSHLFGHTLALQMIDVFKHLSEPEIFEFGAGTGKLCIDVLTKLEAEEKLPRAYHILEVSGHLQTLQQEAIHEAIPHLAHLVIWHQTLPEKPIEGVVIANEVLDAMPVHRFVSTDEGLYEGMVEQQEGNYQETLKPCDNQALATYVSTYVEHSKRPYSSEANLMVEPWLKSCHDILAKGIVLLIDYGFPAHEYYHPDRNMGTLMCHHQHKAHPNPFIHVGEQDITAHVNFTHVADSALKAGFQVSGYTSQAAFLLALGLLNLVDKSSLEDKQAAKVLLQPHEMGELFKVIALGKAFDEPLLGFMLQDKRAHL